jgi:hypothetical protein
MTALYPLVETKASQDTDQLTEANICVSSSAKNLLD